MCTTKTILILFDLLGVGLQMTEAKLFGFVLILITSSWLWWILLFQLSNEGFVPIQHHPAFFLVGGWIAIGAICGFGVWRALGSPHTPPQVVSTIINNYYGASPTPKPEVTLAEPTQLNEKTAEGYQTIVDLTVVSSYPVGNLRLTVLEENVKSFVLGQCDYSTNICRGTEPTGTRDGYPSLDVPNAYGTFTLTLVTAEPIRVLRDSLEFEIQ